MRMSRTVLGGALGETPEVYSLYEGQALHSHNACALLRHPGVTMQSLEYRGCHQRGVCGADSIEDLI